MNLLALDIGKRRTGVAFATTKDGIPLALDTLAHASDKELLTKVGEIAKTKRADELILGLPLLPSGEEGAQVEFVRSVGQELQKMGFLVSYLDERYSTPSGRRPEDREIDADSASACQILQMVLDRKRLVDNNS